MSGSLFAAAPIMAPPLPSINTPVYTTVGATITDPAGVAAAKLAEQKAAQDQQIAQQQQQAAAAQQASNAAAAAELAAQQAAAAKSAIIPMTGQTNSYAPGTAPGTVGSLSADAAGTGLLSPAGEQNLAAQTQPGNSTPNAPSTPPTVTTPVIPPTDTLPDMIDLTPPAALPTTPDIPVADVPPAAAAPIQVTIDTPSPSATPSLTPDNSSTIASMPVVPADTSEPPAPAAPIQTASNSPAPTVTIPQIAPITDNPDPVIQAPDTGSTNLSADQPVQTANSDNNNPSSPPVVPSTQTADNPPVAATAPQTVAQSDSGSSDAGISLDANGHVLQNGKPIPGGSGTSQVTQSNGQTWAQDAASGKWYTVENGQFVSQGNSTPTGQNNETSAAPSSVAANPVAQNNNNNNNNTSSSFNGSGNDSSSTDTSSVADSIPSVLPDTKTSANNSGYALDGNGNITQNGKVIPGSSGTSNLTESNGETWAQDAASGKWFTVENGQFVSQGNSTPTDLASTTPSFVSPVDLSSNLSGSSPSFTSTSGADNSNVPSPSGVRSLVANAASSVYHAAALGTYSSAANNGVATIIADSAPAVVEAANYVSKNGVPPTIAAGVGQATQDPTIASASEQTYNDQKNNPSPPSTNGTSPYSNYTDITTMPLVSAGAILAGGLAAKATGGSPLGAAIFTGTSMAESLLSASAKQQLPASAVAGFGQASMDPAIQDAATETYQDMTANPQNYPHSNDYVNGLLAPPTSVSKTLQIALGTGALAGAAVGGGALSKLAAPATYTAILNGLTAAKNAPIPLDTSSLLPPLPAGMDGSGSTKNSTPSSTNGSSSSQTTSPIVMDLSHITHNGISQ